MSRTERIKNDGSRWTWVVLLSRLVFALVIVVGLTFALYRPDRPVAEIIPGSSIAPSFVVQVIRPRVGLPLGGMVPPQFVGLEAHLGFDSSSPGASIGDVGRETIELRADDWQVRLALDSDDQVSPATEAHFKLTLAGRIQRVVCRPADPPVGTLSISTLADSAGFSGSFDIELKRCELAGTGQPLGWPSAPLVLHGSFDRL